MQHVWALKGRRHLAAAPGPRGRQASATCGPCKGRCAAARIRCMAWGRTQQIERLWDYDGSCVKATNLAELQLLHRRSFGHRNSRTYAVVLYAPNSPACQAVEAQIERLACGLLHEPSLAVAALDTSSKEAAQFVGRIMGVTSLPAVLLYPEAAPGYLRYAGPDFTTEGMLAAINKARSRSMPNVAELELVEAYTPLGLLGLEAQAAAERAGDYKWVRHRGSSQQQQQHQQNVTATPLQVGAAGYWSPGKALFWSFVVGFSVFGYLWDRVLSEAWEAWCLQRRQAARQLGRSFSMQENVDDFLQLLMNRKIAEVAEGKSEEEDVGLGQRAKGVLPLTGWVNARDGSIRTPNSSSSSSGSRTGSLNTSSMVSNGRHASGQLGRAVDGPLVPAESWQAVAVEGQRGEGEVFGGAPGPARVDNMEHGSRASTSSNR